jgi:hypothetical protein
MANTSWKKYLRNIISDSLLNEDTANASLTKIKLQAQDNNVTVDRDRKMQQI